MEYTSIDEDFNALSLPELLVARDQFHIHLMHKSNVVGTAVGRYRIRKSDPWPNEHNPTGDAPIAKHFPPARTLSNSEVRNYSWAAILVFVNRWMQINQFSDPQDAIPRAVYLPNGHKVPICVVLAERADMQTDFTPTYRFPANYLGGGYPVLCDVQNREQGASIGCIVTDGHRMYALTNRHVAGEDGTPIYSIVGGNKVIVGKAATKRCTRELFEKIYPGWIGKNVYVDLDAGLIDIDDVSQWSTQVYGLGPLGPMADFDTSNLSLRLIGCPVRAHGAASGDMRGEVCALFYRFASVGGFEYMSDLLIGPRSASPLGTHHGDSGTLWAIDDQSAREGASPVALQWGGQVFLDATAQGSSYALATLLSTVCNLLDVSLVRDWHEDLPDYWGAVGHYSIATKAFDVIANRKLKKLLGANLERISFSISSITKKNMAGLSNRPFVPLADVPDMVWKVGPHKRGGMNSPEHDNHFADMDRCLTRPLPEGSTLLEICADHPENVAPDVWRRYYDAVQEQFSDEKESRGLLPFRVWQIYDHMVEAVRKGNVAEFVCAAGILSHYVGDACQPLHISYLFNGDPDHPVKGFVRDKKTGKNVEGEVPRGVGVHSAYEDDMVNNHTPEIIAGIDAILSKAKPQAKLLGGHAAAVATVALMQSTFDAIKPMDIIDAFVAEEQNAPKVRANALWDKVGKDTVHVMADGCLCLATLWESAWKEGGGDQTISSLASVDEAVLERLYQNPAFLPSHRLDTIGLELKGAAASVIKTRNTSSRHTRVVSRSKP